MKTPALDRVKGGLGAFVLRITSRVDYLALYPCVVVAQSGQLLDLQPDSGQMAALTGVPLRLGLPGVEVTVAPGTRVLLGFEGGDPSKPVASLWEASTGVLELKLGLPATEFVAKANLVLEALEHIASKFNEHTHPAPGGTTSAPLPAQFITAPLTVGSAVVKVK